ncbi:MAG: hypothetical protein LBF22_05455 [Deltaproteobacteria bacterium]|jgi:hypothetical protein|nr:hypothetical protein [Deltaproteobacteria bacterium]
MPVRAKFKYSRFFIDFKAMPVLTVKLYQGSFETMCAKRVHPQRVGHEKGSYKIPFSIRSGSPWQVLWVRYGRGSKGNGYLGEVFAKMTRSEI